MKKLLSIIVLLLCFVASEAQSYIIPAPDTLKNANSQIMVWDGTSSTAYKQVNFEITATKVSGTVGGKCLIEVSDTGTNWVKHGSADSLVLTNSATNFKIISAAESALKYRKYRVRCTGTGTMAAILTTRLTFFKEG